MGNITTKVTWNGALRFTGANGKGHETVMDGDTQAGPSPVEILLEALGACAAVDVVTILEKSRTPAQKLEVTLTGNRHEPEPRYYTGTVMRFDIWGAGIRPETVTRAINLSVTKYCSVYHSLRGDLKLQPEFRLHVPAAAAAGEYHVVEMGVPTGDLG
ncbi:MAG: OsmC family protein [Acidobacteria bacterium]|nr:OsmC family protein [Acidobacteriota bacterium]MBI3425013.1 OsmC family protein [Acidobacteriota bacterium]